MRSDSTRCTPRAMLAQRTNHRGAGAALATTHRGAGAALALGAALTLFSPRPARANDFVDTRLNLTLTNENVLTRPGETNPPVPGWRFDRPSNLGVLFFDNYDTRFTGYESLTHIVLFKSIQRQRWEAEAAYVLRLLQFSDVNLSSIDDGSYLKINYYLDRTRTRRTNISLTAFPLNSDRMRLGYSWRLSWGGSPMFYKANPDIPTNINPPPTAPVPGLRLQIADDRWYAYTGAKTTVLRQDQDQELHSVYGLLAGAGYDLVPQRLRVEANGGYFYRGTVPRILTQALPVQTAGGSVQVSLFRGLTPSLSADTALYRNDLGTAMRYLAKPVYAPGWMWLIMAEFTAVATTLENPDLADSTRWQLGMAGDINVRVQHEHLRLRLDASFRSLEFILLNQPSLVPFQDFPRDVPGLNGKPGQVGATIDPNFFVAAGFDYFIERLGLTPGLTFGMDRPASYKPPPGGVNPLTDNSSSVLVVRNQGDVTILPAGQTVFPAIAAKLSVRKDFLELFAFILESYYQYDPNQTHLRARTASLAMDGAQMGCSGGDQVGAVTDGTKVRVFECPHRLGFNFTLQARF